MPLTPLTAVSNLVDNRQAILVEQQEHAIEYEEDADEGYFVTSMELNNETPIRINASEQSGEQ